jgi:hypothetical protein
MWATAMVLMVISDWNEVWWVEILFVRMPFTIYAGWLTSATILNTTGMLKTWGVIDEPNGYGWTFL